MREHTTKDTSARVLALLTAAAATPLMRTTMTRARAAESEGKCESVEYLLSERSM